jgi:hypothetical protein
MMGHQLPCGAQPNGILAWHTLTPAPAISAALFGGS